MPKGIGVYPADWVETSIRCKNEAGWRCVRCGWPHEPETGHCLTVHHLDGDKGNCEWWNLAALCQRCHLHIQSKVVMRRVWMFDHSEWFKPYVAGLYASMQGVCTDREFVMAHLERLLAFAQGIRFEGGDDGEVKSGRDEAEGDGMAEGWPGGACC